MVSREARDELRRKMDDVVMSLVAVGRAEDDIAADLVMIAKLITEAKKRLEQTIGDTVTN